MSISAASVGSPCVNICRMDDTSGWCEGCMRTLDEIAAWSAMSDDGKRAVLAQLGRRRVAWRAMRAAARSAGEAEGGSR